MKSVHVTNYQSIAAADVELHPGVNVLLGPSDSGKSAFIRAIRDCAFGATGTGMLRVGMKRGGKCVVQIDAVEWIKSKSDNGYDLNSDTDPRQFRKVGRDVPDEIRQALGIFEIEFGKGISKRLQFATQFEPHFIVGENPADNAKVLGKLADLHVVYNAIREGERQHREARKAAADLEERAIDQKQTLEVMNDAVDLAEKDRQTAEEAAHRYRVGLDRLSGLTSLEGEYGRLVSEIEGLLLNRREIDEQKLRGVSVRWANMRTIRTNLREVRAEIEEAREGQTAAVDLDRLETLGARVRELGEIRRELRETEAGIDEAEASKVAVDLPTTKDLVGRALRLREIRQEFGDVCGKMPVERENLRKLSELREKIGQKLAEVEVCPICGKSDPGLKSN